MTVDPHVQALRDLSVAEHEQRMAEVQEWADEARTAGNVDRQRRHLEHLARLRAMPYPWEQQQPAA